MSSKAKRHAVRDLSSARRFARKSMETIRRGPAKPWKRRSRRQVASIEQRLACEEAAPEFRMPTFDTPGRRDEPEAA